MKKYEILVRRLQFFWGSLCYVRFLHIQCISRNETMATGCSRTRKPSRVRIHEFHDYLLWLITAITIFVLALLVYVCVRFKASRNPNPSKTTHNTTIEVLWTVVPVLILVVVAVPSFKTLYYGDRAVDPEHDDKSHG